MLPNPPAKAFVEPGFRCGGCRPAFMIR